MAFPSAAWSSIIITIEFSSHLPPRPSWTRRRSGGAQTLMAASSKICPPQNILPPSKYSSFKALPQNICLPKFVSLTKFHLSSKVLCLSPSFKVWHKRRLIETWSGKIQLSVWGQNILSVPPFFQKILFLHLLLAILLFCSCLCVFSTCHPLSHLIFYIPSIPQPATISCHSRWKFMQIIFWV